jgi:hypothetical protein
VAAEVVADTVVDAAEIAVAVAGADAAEIAATVGIVATAAIAGIAGSVFLFLLTVPRAALPEHNHGPDFPSESWVCLGCFLPSTLRFSQPIEILLVISPSCMYYPAELSFGSISTGGPSLTRRSRFRHFASSAR